MPLVKGPNIACLPSFEPLAKQFKIPVLLKVGDNISTDEILPPSICVLPDRSNIAKISEFIYDILYSSYVNRLKIYQVG